MSASLRVYVPLTRDFVTNDNSAIKCESITGEIPHFVRDDDVTVVDLDEAGAFGNKMPNAPASSPTTQNHHVIPNEAKRNEESPEILQRHNQVVINARFTKDLLFRLRMTWSDVSSRERRKLSQLQSP